MLSKIQQEVPFKVMDSLFKVPDNHRNHLRIIDALAVVAVTEHQVIAVMSKAATDQNPVEVIVSASSSSNKAWLIAKPQAELSLMALITGAIAQCAQVIDHLFSTLFVTQNTRRSTTCTPLSPDFSIPDIHLVSLPKSYGNLDPGAPLLQYLGPCW